MKFSKKVAQLKSIAVTYKAHELEGTNLSFSGFKLDRNGNFPNQPGFTIQTNGNLPKTHNLRGDVRIFQSTPTDLQTIKEEVVDYIKKYGSEKQKTSLKVY